MKKYIMLILIFFLGINLYSQSKIDISKVSLSKEEIIFLKGIENKQIDILVYNHLKSTTWNKKRPFFIKTRYNVVTTTNIKGVNLWKKDINILAYLKEKKYCSF